MNSNIYVPVLGGKIMNFDVAETSIKNSIFSVTVKDSRKIIGMGRIVLI